MGDEREGEADEKGDDGVAERVRETVEDAVAERSRFESADRPHEHEPNRDEDRQERLQRAGESPAGRLGLGRQVFGQVMVAAAEDVSRDERDGDDGDGDEHAEQDHEAEVGAEDAGDRERSGGGGHEHVRGVQAHREGHGHERHAAPRIARQALGERCEQHERGIAEHGDADEIAGGRETESGMLGARDPEHGLRHLLGASAFFHQGAHHGSDGNHHADSGDGRAESAGIGVHHGVHVESYGETERERGEREGEERVEPYLDGERHEKGDRGGDAAEHVG